MSFGIIRIEKYKKSDVRGIEKHNKRIGKSKTNEDINYDLTKNNYSLKRSTGTYEKNINDIIKTLNLKKSLRSNINVMLELMVTSDEEFFKKLSLNEQMKFFEKAYEFLSDKYGEKNIISAEVHMDEKVPHMHIDLVPVTIDGRLSAKEIFTPSECRKLQDEAYNNVFKKYGLERGVVGEVDEKGYSKKKHKTMQEIKARDLIVKEEELNQKEDVLKQEKERLRQLDIELQSQIKNVNKRVFEAKKEISELEERKQELEERKQELEERNKELEEENLELFSSMKGSALTKEEIMNIINNAKQNKITGSFSGITKNDLENLGKSALKPIDKSTEFKEILDRKERSLDAEKEVVNKKEKSLLQIELKQKTRHKEQEKKEEELNKKEEHVNKREKEVNRKEIEYAVAMHLIKNDENGLFEKFERSVQKNIKQRAENRQKRTNDLTSNIKKPNVTNDYQLE